MQWYLNKYKRRIRISCCHLIFIMEMAPLSAVMVEQRRVGLCSSDGCTLYHLLGLADMGMGVCSGVERDKQELCMAFVPMGMIYWVMRFVLGTGRGAGGLPICAVCAAASWHFWGAHCHCKSVYCANDYVCWQATS